MPIIARSALLPYNAAALYDLVNDVGSYPQFMDGCVGAIVIAQGDDFMEARLDLARGGIRQSFTTRNTLYPKTRIDLQLVDGPFERFGGAWQFVALGEQACKVSLDLSFTMSGTVANAATGKLFEAVANNLVEAVSRRARQHYG
jgi:ribosome-associated toxin RatA of RatAB toxin-antitoxin module